jgi:GMP synthase-like glutamine amidotransferase
VIADGPWMQWHYDVVTLPTGAELMAANEVGPQAWRLDRMFCTQFHPEVTESVVHRWASGPGGNELAALGMTADALLADTRAALSAAEANTNRLVDWFCDEVVS